MEVKKCSKCKSTQPLDNFSNSRNSKRSDCKDCNSKYRKKNNKRRLAYLKDWAKKNPEKVREQKYRHRYGIDISEYNRLLEEQGGSCKICKSKDKKRKNAEFFAVDHCHKTGKVRGLLCYNCNSGLGKFKDDPELVEKALSYLLSISK